MTDVLANGSVWKPLWVAVCPGRFLRAFGAAVLALTSAPLPAVQLSFVPSKPTHAAAAADYAELWAAEGAGILRAFEKRACASIPVPAIEVTVTEAASYSGDADTPMRLRASYPEPVKRGTLVHELGHWIIPPAAIESMGLSTHQALNLLLLQVWDDLWGPAFVEQQIAAERRWSPAYRHDWDWARSLSAEQRGATWHALLAATGARCDQPGRGEASTVPSAEGHAGPQETTPDVTRAAEQGRD